MIITQEHLKQIMRRYMIQNDLDFISIKASLNYAKDDVVISFIEDENINFSLN